VKIIKTKDASVDEIVTVLKKGGLVIYPTETVYGVGVDATNSDAIKKLNLYKKRPFGKPYSIAVSDEKMAKRYVFINETAKNLYKNFLPGPMTVISKGKGRVAKGVESEDGTLGIRIPNYVLVVDIVKKLGSPITATSANASYKKRPYKITDILDNISANQKKLLDLIIDAGTLPPREPSTVVDTTSEDNIVLRQGDIKLKSRNQVRTFSPEATQNIAKELWQKYEKHHKNRAIVFALKGKMGTGKTVFTKGLAKALGIKDIVTSPTYNLEQDYGNGKLHHIDVWRLRSVAELRDLEIDKYIRQKSVIAIEWADKITDAVRPMHEDAVVLWVEILYGIKNEERIIYWGIEKG